MADWFVFRPDGAHLGPWSTERVAAAILRGEIPENVWLAVPNGARWLCALDVPVIVTLVRGMPIPASKRESGMRVVAAQEEEVTLPSARRADLQKIEIDDESSTETMLTRPVDLRLWTDESLADTYPSARPPVTIDATSVAVPPRPPPPSVPEDQRVTRERPAHPPSSKTPASDLYSRLRRAAPASERVPRDPADVLPPDDEDDAPTRRAVLLGDVYEPTLVSPRAATNKK